MVIIYSPSYYSKLVWLTFFSHATQKETLSRMCTLLFSMKSSSKKDKNLHTFLLYSKPSKFLWATYMMLFCLFLSLTLLEVIRKVLHERSSVFPPTPVGERKSGFYQHERELNDKIWIFAWTIPQRHNDSSDSRGNRSHSSPCTGL